MLNPAIIRAYDIRGVFNETLFAKDAWLLGKAFAQYLINHDKKTVTVGYDGRTTSPQLSTELIKGLCDSGIDVINVGLGPTPMTYFSLYHFNADAAIMVTGSHNPKNHNGFKIALKDRPFFGEDLQNLANMINAGKFITAKGSVKNIDIKKEYIKRLLQNINIDPSLNIVWDCGNGATGEIISELIKKLPNKNKIIFAKIDGNFPNHHPDPTIEENLDDLKNNVKNNKANLGIAFDGDGDRIGAVDEEGTVVWGDQLMTIYARSLLKEKPGATIIADVKASQSLFDEIVKMGGKAIMNATGHSLIKSAMKKENAQLAGEMSGHIFFADKYYGFDDAIYASLRLIECIMKEKKTLKQIRLSLPKTFSTPEKRIDCDEEKKFQIIEDIKNILKSDNISFNDIDGIRSNNQNGWFLIRASNTQSCLVVRCESETQDGLEILQKIVQELLKKAIPMGF